MVKFYYGIKQNTTGFVTDFSQKIVLNFVINQQHASTCNCTS